MGVSSVQDICVESFSCNRILESGSFLNLYDAVSLWWFWYYVGVKVVSKFVKNTHCNLNNLFYFSPFYLPASQPRTGVTLSLLLRSKQIWWSCESLNFIFQIHRKYYTEDFPAPASPESYWDSAHYMVRYWGTAHYMVRYLDTAHYMVRYLDTAHYMVRYWDTAH